MSELLLKEVQLLRENELLIKEILRDKVVQLQDRDVQLQDKDVQLQDKEEKIEEQKNQVEMLEIKTQELKNAYEAEIEKRISLQRLIFGKKSEKFVEDIEGQEPLPLFELDADQIECDEADLEEIKYKRPKSKGRKKQDVSQLPQREVIIPVGDEERVCGCGAEKQVVRYDTKHLLHYIPGKLEVEVQKREVLACQKGCEKSIVTAPVIPQILPKARATESLLAYISVSKVLDRQPLYHLEKKIEREHGWHIPRKTMSRWMILMADKLQPLVNLMKEELLSYDVAAIDATTLQVLKEPKRHSETKSQAYCIRGGPPGKEVTIYEYNGYRQQNYVTDLFTDYTGFISSDASPVFNGIEAKKDITLSYCHAHARRKFETNDILPGASSEVSIPALQTV